MLPIKIELPVDFLNEEVRCDYTISHEMKKVWAVELDLLVEFQSVCRKYGLRYFAYGGTLLGAIRHQGFIPWDDDIDVLMLRKDYDEFVKVAEKEFRHPYFFQTEDTDRFSARGHAQIRNTLTTGILKSEEEFRFTFNQGIFLDVFVLDNVPEDEQERLEFYRKVARIKKKMSLFRNASCKEAVKGSHGVNKQIKSILYLFLHGRKNPYYSKLHECCSSLEGKTDLIGDCLFETEKPDLVFDASIFDSVESKPFEFIDVDVPRMYTEMLDVSYGNWHEFVKGTSEHGGVIFDPEHSYRTWFGTSGK